MTHIYALVSGQLVLYVGKTNDVNRREGEHRSKNEKTHSKYIPDYIDWTLRVLQTVPKDKEIVKEQYYYDTLKPLYNNRRPGQTKKEISKKYNQTEAGKEAQRRYYLKKKSKAPVDETTVYQAIN
jgi:predicted GIY-YIG superfamily endonuclease